MSNACFGLWHDLLFAGDHLDAWLIDGPPQTDSFPCLYLCVCVCVLCVCCVVCVVYMYGLRWGQRHTVDTG